MSPLKVRAVTTQIQGMHALEAQALLANVPRKSARLVSKTLKSAMANAENIIDEWDVDDLRGRISELEQIQCFLSTKFALFIFYEKKNYIHL